MKAIRVLWADDEIDLLRPHIMFLEEKGYLVDAVNNGRDAVDKCKTNEYEAVFLDENMPGLNGLDALQQIKNLCPALPVVMITKSEEENLMEQAIGQQIADYLIKPVNPNQLLMSLKKVVHGKDIVSQKTTTDYQTEFRQISMQIGDSLKASEWIELYRKLLYWELKIASSAKEMDEVLQLQKTEANAAFCKFIKKNYENWFKAGAEHPVLSPDVFKTKLFPCLDKGEKVFFVLIDNLRLDQWYLIRNELSGLYNLSDDDCFFSILPTATQYSRNAIFSGLMPQQIRKMYPELWVDEEEDEGKNLNEERMIATQLERYRKKYRFSYHKINNNQAGEKLNETLKSLLVNDFNVVVFNFVDMLSHARTEVKLFREIAPDEDGYRALVLSWFQHSAIADFFRILAENKVKVIITTDHGSIRVKNPIKVIGDKNTNVNLRYKVGKNLSYNKNEVLAINRPESIGLPAPNLSSSYIFAAETDFFAYPNNYNYYVSYYKDTFQHGGISLEEMIIPLATLTAK